MKLILIIIGLFLSCNFSDRSSIDEKVHDIAQATVIGADNCLSDRAFLQSHSGMEAITMLHIEGIIEYLERTV